MTLGKTNPTHTPSLLQFIFSGLAALGAWGTAFLILLVGLISMVAPTEDSTSQVSTLLVGVVVAAIGCCFVPSAYYGLKRVLGRPITTSPFQLPRYGVLAILCWPVLVYLGLIIPDGTIIRMMVFPFIHVLAVLIPIMVLVWIGSRGLVANSPQRKSGLFALGLAFGTSVSFVIEMGVLLVIALVGIFVVAANPTSIETLNRLSEQFSSPNIDIQSLQSLLAPYITSPIAILGILGFFSVLTPLIEEAAKPIGLWFFAKKNLTPMDGFVGGMLSGAGFTVVETMFNAGQSNPESWFVLIISRVGTGALHILASGMVGWGLAMAWSKHKYMNLFFSYLIAVCLHGLWNGVTLFYGISELLPEGSDSWLVIFGKINPYILGILATAIFLSLIFINLKFVKEQTMQLDPTASPDGVG